MSAAKSAHPNDTLRSWFANRAGDIYRVVGYLLVGFSFFLWAHAAYDEDRGIAAPPYVPTKYTRPVETRDKHPALFRALMNYEWTCPVLFFLAGSLILGIVRRADRTDPFSPSFAGDAALDECERTLDDELEKKHRPLRW